MVRVLLVLGFAGVLAFGQTQLVLYSSGLALVEETRRLTVSEEGVLELSGFPEGTLWETLTVGGLETLRLSPASPEPWSLKRLLGQEVTVQTRTTVFRGILREVLAEGLVLETREGVVLLRDYEWLRGPRYAPASSAQALLAYRSPEPGVKELRFRYLTWGLSWKIVYEALFQSDVLQVLGKAVIQNDTGVEFSGAALTLIAGEVRAPAKDVAVRALAAFPEAPPTETFEYYRYDLPGSWDLAPGVAVLPLMRGAFPATKFYRFDGAAVAVWIRFTPTDQILPAGELRAYAEGIFVGASSLPSLPKGKSAELPVGYAFDLTGTRAQVKRERMGENLFRDTWRVLLRSTKAEETEVEVIESLSGYWQILTSTLPYEVLDAQRVRFVVPVAPGGETSLEYTVEWRY